MRNVCIFIPLLLDLPLVFGQQSGLRPVYFIFDNSWVTWKEAQTFCRKKQMDLVTIRSEEESQIVPSDGRWIGLYRENLTSPWKWSRGGETATFFDWASTEPQDDEHCGFKWPSTSKWFNGPCDANHRIMCSDEKLLLVKENKTWEEALEHCRSLQDLDSVNPASVFYDLASMVTEDDHSYAGQRAQQATSEEVWTGLRYLGDEWFWMGGEQVQYQDLPSCPAARCGVLEKNKGTSFGIRDCSQRRNFFCYKRPKNQ